MQDTIDSGIIAAFNDELNQLYWSGYADHLESENPEMYYMLLAAFRELFGSG